jgi:hypothetical protein
MSSFGIEAFTAFSTGVTGMAGRNGDVSPADAPDGVTFAFHALNPDIEIRQR